MTIMNAKGLQNMNKYQHTNKQTFQKNIWYPDPQAALSIISKTTDDAEKYTKKTFSTCASWTDWDIGID